MITCSSQKLECDWVQARHTGRRAAFDTARTASDTADGGRIGQGDWAAWVIDVILSLKHITTLWSYLLWLKSKCNLLQHLANYLKNAKTMM